MKINRVKQFDLIRETDPVEFKTKLNETMKRLAEDKPEIDIDVSGEIMNALIKYTEAVVIEDPKEDDDMIRFTCGECPCFAPPTKSDGTPDLRVKWGKCPHADMHRTHRWSHACGMLYKMIKNGDIVLTLNDIQD